MQQQIDSIMKQQMINKIYCKQNKGFYYSSFFSIVECAAESREYNTPGFVMNGYNE